MKKKELERDGLSDTLIGANTVFEGTIQLKGVIHIEGKVKGNLKIDGDVFIGENAVITGDIFSNNVNLSGKVEGSIFTKGYLKMLSTAKLYGDMQVHSFSANEGCIIQGKCSVIDSSQSEIKVDSTVTKTQQSKKEGEQITVVSRVYEERMKNGNID